MAIKLCKNCGAGLSPQHVSLGSTRKHYYCSDCGTHCYKDKWYTKKEWKEKFIDE